ncbi:hypothetical protein [uncultured Veillonella sp.]|uniref:hypothetical protein n=1 Tax=uncultured Veillonella sp. TaxID=159268 RepID=UPI002805A869|nr:hypothetical protein [uncultured Veillonella sp.]
MESTQELIKKLKETQRDLQWQYDMELYRLESRLKKKEKAIDDLNASIFKATQENMEKDKIIEALGEQIKQMNIKTDLEKRVADLEERLKPKNNAGDTEEKLQRYKWYNSTTFTEYELLKKLGTGVLVEVILNPFKDNKEQEPEETEVKTVRVQYISKNAIGKTVLSVGDLYYRKWFRVI